MRPLRETEPWAGRRQSLENVDRQRAYLALAIVSVIAVCSKAGVFRSAYDFFNPGTSPPVSVREGVQWTTASHAAMNGLHVTTPPGNESYAVKVVEEGSNRQIAMLFIGPGSRVDTMLDPGVYRLRYARGKIWRGDEPLFGRETLVFETAPMRFTVDAGGYGGHRVHLDDVLGGNLPKRRISERGF